MEEWVYVWMRWWWLTYELVGFVWFQPQVDREEVALHALSASIHKFADGKDENVIHIGGVEASDDSRFTDFAHFDGCISSNSLISLYSSA